jgi:hypothetical protein
MTDEFHVHADTCKDCKFFPLSMACYIGAKLLNPNLPDTCEQDYLCRMQEGIKIVSGVMADSHDPSWPQWVRSRLKAVQKRKGCGSTHMACRCFIEKIINLEAEVAKLRELRRAQHPKDQCVKSDCSECREMYD